MPAFSIVLYTFAFVGLCDRQIWRSSAVVLPIALISFTVVHAIYWSDVRMRAPIIPALAVLAALGCERLTRRRATLV